MKLWIGLRVQFILLISILLIRIGGAHAAVDHTLYGDLLLKYVKNGVVDYAGFKREEDRLNQYLKVLERTETGSLDRNEQFAFYINAYNAWTIKLILSLSLIHI